MSDNSSVRISGAGTSTAPAPDWSACARSREDFVGLVCKEGKRLYRDLPWRNVDDGYAVLVSEVMLQQTQVARVVRYWTRWMELFPTVDALAASDTATVLEMWQGLGYNRRALALKRACEECSRTHGGDVPRDRDALMALPGVGPATAAGVMAFAYDLPATYIETNVRSVFIHELFPDAEKVSDRQIAPYVEDVCPQTGARAWYYALLDYGAHLKTKVANPSRKSAHYARQSPFSGSRREKRSFILQQVLAAESGVSRPEVLAALDAHERENGRGGMDATLFDDVVAELLAEGFFSEHDGLLVP